MTAAGGYGFEACLPARPMWSRFDAGSQVVALELIVIVDLNCGQVAGACGHDGATGLSVVHGVLTRS
jgi:hypothetical protein